MWKKYIPFLILLVVVDQLLKIWVKTTLPLGGEISVIGDWFYIHFVENPGIAFGGKIEHPLWKPFLSVFRIVAITVIGWYILRLIKRRSFPAGFIICCFLIWAGAIGNLVDSVFYGLVFDASHYNKVAEIFPQVGYAPLLYGKVVDMFYFPLVEIDKMPEWIPFLGGERFVFFRPVFNLADSYITVGMACIMLFYKEVISRI